MIAPDAPYQGQDIYCDEIIPGIRPVKKVLETDHVLAFHHTRPFWPVHIVVIPKRHIDSLLTLHDADQELAMEMIEVIQHVANQVIADHGSAAVLTNLGSYQDSKHLHWHIHFGQPLR
jgi:histidine triad (HIT) family protein